MLPYYLILCRSLTFAQRTALVLERVGIPAPIQRAPAAAGRDGCSHAVRVREYQLTRALAILARAGLTPGRVFLEEPGGEVREVEV